MRALFQPGLAGFVRFSPVALAPGVAAASPHPLPFSHGERGDWKVAGSR